MAKRRLSKFRNVDFVLSDISTSSLPDGSFDVIVVSYVLHDIPKKERSEIVCSLAKKVKPSGRIHLREPTKASHGMPVEEIRMLMNNAGMKESHATVGKGEFTARYSNA